MKTLTTHTAASSKVLALFAMILAMASVPTVASAGSLHIDVPHIGISLHNSHGHQRRYNRHNRRHYNSSNYYNSSPRYYNRGYNSGYSSGYNNYNRPSRYNQGYNDGYSDSYNGSNYCPTPGYSSRYYNNRGCYSHGNHYHCE